VTDKTYCYPPDYAVLKNKANIRDGSELANFENFHVRSRSLSLPSDTQISYSGYKAIHQHIFQDVYHWAGKPRSVNISKGGDLFASWRFIDNQMEKRFGSIKKENNLKNLDPLNFAEKAAEHINEINAIHPFREGNGRVQRLFLKNLAYQAGHKIDLSLINKSEWIRASIEGFRELNHKAMAKCITSALDKKLIQEKTNPVSHIKNTAKEKKPKQSKEQGREL